jgi:CDGSH-type Zn-finger protein
MESMAPNAVAVCCCGGLTTESICNGTHTKVGFRAAQRAVRKEGGKV